MERLSTSDQGPCPWGGTESSHNQPRLTRSGYTKRHKLTVWRRFANHLTLSGVGPNRNQARFSNRRGPARSENLLHHSACPSAATGTIQHNFRGNDLAMGSLPGIASEGFGAFGSHMQSIGFGSWWRIRPHPGSSSLMETGVWKLYRGALQASHVLPSARSDTGSVERRARGVAMADGLIGQGC